MGKRNFSTKSAKQLDISMENKETRTPTTLRTKINLKQMRDLNVKTKMIKCLELKRHYIHDLGVGKDFFFKYTQKPITIKENTDTLNFIEI